MAEEESIFINVVIIVSCCGQPGIHFIHCSKLIMLTHVRWVNAEVSRLPPVI